MSDRIWYCHACTLALPPAPGMAGAAACPCPRCGAAMHHRLPRSVTRSTALTVAGFIMLVPANVLPVVALNSIGRSRTDTIASGVLSLWHEGLWGIALIVFTASILVPLLKLLSLGVLLRSVQSRPVRHRRSLTRLYAFVKFIGRWSMLDVFLVAFLTGAVQFGVLASVHPGPGVIAFAAAVVLTILATESFDSRLLWDDARYPDRSSP
jgi:paraquat-inducible protein A